MVQAGENPHVVGQGDGELGKHGREREGDGDGVASFLGLDLRFGDLIRNGLHLLHELGFRHAWCWSAELQVQTRPRQIDGLVHQVGEDCGLAVVSMS